MRHRGGRSFARNPPRVGPWVALLILVLLVLRAYFSQTTSETFPFDPETPYFVERVVDGDTLLLRDGHRVRLLGVDTPETVAPNRPREPWGAEASAFTRDHVERRWITLNFDRERRDQYDRILAYVYLDGWFLNEELIRAGYSPAVLHFPYSDQMKKRFRTAEAEARTERRGIWSRNGAPVGDRSVN